MKDSINDSVDDSPGVDALFAPPTERTGAGVIDTSVLCITCGYNLIGLTHGDVCPECGTPAVNSTRGTMLIHSSPEHTARLHKGVFTVQAAIITAIIVGVLLLIAGFATATASGGSSMGLQIFGQVIQTGAWAAVLYGWWLFSEPDPHYTGKDAGDGARKFVRISVIVQAAVIAIGFIVGLGQIGSGSANVAALTAWDILAVVMMLIGLASQVLWFVASMLYLKWLGARLPDARVVKRAGLLVWLGPVLSTVGVLVLVGPLIALILYYNLLDWVRKDIRAIRAEQSIDALKQEFAH